MAPHRTGAPACRPERRSGGDAFVLGLEILLDAFNATLAAETAGLEAAERCRRVGDDALVQAHHAGFEGFAHP
jgi:hypothetical protein